MTKIDGYLRMDHDQLEDAIAKEREKIKRAKTNISLLEKLKIATHSTKGNNERRNDGNDAKANAGEYHHQ